MSLSAREEQILGSIEDRLARSDPKLTTMLATFTRLASAEAMPVREKIHAARLLADFRAPRPPGHDVGRRRARRQHQRSGLPRYGVLWLAMVVAVALVAITVAVNRGSSGQGSCITSWSAVCAGQVGAHPTGSQAHQVASGHPSRVG